MATPASVAAQQRTSPDAVASLRDATGRVVGDAAFRQGDGQVMLTIVFASEPGLTGPHGLRVHSVGRCDPPDFLTAGDGFNPTGKQHGLNNPAGPQIGDLPNVDLEPDAAPYTASMPGATLGTEPTSLLAGPGTALILYSGPDDQLTQPDGNAGARIACGVIMSSAAAVQPTPVSPSPAPASSAAVPQPSVARPASPGAAQLASSPTPVLILATPPPTAAGSPTGNSRQGDVTTAVVVGALALLLIGAGLVLRRGPPRAP